MPATPTTPATLAPMPPLLDGAQGRLLAGLTLAATVLVAAALTLTGCGRDTTLHPQRPTVGADSPVPVNPERVRDLCDFFAYRSLETLAEPAAQGNVSLYADRPGVPYQLAKVAHDYYADGITAPDTPAHRNELTTRYASVLHTCQTSGTGWQRP